MVDQGENDSSYCSVHPFFSARADLNNLQPDYLRLVCMAALAEIDVLHQML